MICNCCPVSGETVSEWRVVQVNSSGVCITCDHYAIQSELTQIRYEAAISGKPFPKNWSKFHGKREKKVKKEHAKDTTEPSEIKSKETLSPVQRERLRKEARRSYMPMSWIKRGYEG